MDQLKEVRDYLYRRSEELLADITARTLKINGMQAVAASLSAYRWRDRVRRQVLRFRISRAETAAGNTRTAWQKVNSAYIAAINGEYTPALRILNEDACQQQMDARQAYVGVSDDDYMPVWPSEPERLIRVINEHRAAVFWG